MFLSQIEHETFREVQSPPGYSSLSKEKQKATRSLANERNIVITKFDKGSCVVIWDRNNHITEAEKQLNYKSVFKSVHFDKNLIPNLWSKSSL